MFAALITATTILDLELINMAPGRVGYRNAKQSKAHARTDFADHQRSGRE